MLSLIKAVGKYFSKKDNMTMVWKRYQLVPTRDIDDKRTLYYVWTRGTSAHTQPIVVLSDAYLCLSPSKKYKYWFLIPNIAHQRILQYNWMRQKKLATPKQQWYSNTLTSSELHAKKLAFQLMSLRKIDDQWILQSDWMRCWNGLA